MPQGIGSKAFIAFTRETTYGTEAPAVSGGYNRVKSVTVKNRGEQTAGNRNLGKPFASCQRVHAKKSSGEIVMDMSYQGYERFIADMFGAGSDAYTNGASLGDVDDNLAAQHIFTPKIAQAVGSTLEVHADLYQMSYPGQKITGLRFNFKRNDPLEMAVTVVGLPHTTPDPPDAAATGVAFLEEVVIAGVNSIPCINPVETSGGFVFSVGTAGGTGYAAVGIIEGDLSIEKPHDENRGNIGSATIAEPVANGEEVMKFNGNIRKAFLDATFITPFLQGIQKAFKWTYTSPNTIETTAGTMVWTFEIEAKYVRFLESPPEVTGSGPIEDSIPFICESPDGTTAPLTITLRNALIGAVPG